MKIVSNVKNPEKQDEIATGFLGGLNTFQDETVLKNSELTEAKNIMLSVDGIEPRPGTLNFGGASSDTSVKGAIGFYLSNGTREFIRMSGGKLKKKVSATTWSQIGSTTFDTSARMSFLQARDRLYGLNGVDPFFYYDGTNIVVYTTLTTPGAPTVAPQGTTGSTAYSYRISALNDVGETLAGTGGTTSTGNAVLNATNYNHITWTAVSGAVKYNVYGRTSTGLAETYLDTVFTNVYDDKGQRDPSVTLLPPTGDSTTGVICKKAIFAISRIFAAGDPSNPSRLYYSGAGDQLGKFGYFTVASGTTYYDVGGGWIDVFKNDGSQIRDIMPFQGGVIIWKDNAIYKYSIDATTGQGRLEEITRSFGGISFFGAKHVENDIIFPAKKDGRLAFYSLGNQENYAGTILRTNELSIKIASRLTQVNMAYLQYSAGFYFNNIYGCIVTTENSTVNNRVWCLDTRFGAWVYWEGIKANQFMTYTDTDGSEKLYACSEDTGYMIEMFQTDRNDNGVAIDVRFSTKSFNQKLFHKYKKYFNPTFQFKDVNQSGVLNGEIYLDGAILTAGFTINQQTGGGAGVGVYLVGFDMPGDAPGGIVSTQGISSDIIEEVKTVKKARSIKYNFISSSKDLRYKFLSVGHQFFILGEKNLPSTSRVYA